MLYLAEIKHKIIGCFVWGFFNYLFILSPVDKCSPGSQHTFAIILKHEGWSKLQLSVKNTNFEMKVGVIAPRSPLLLPWTTCLKSRLLGLLSNKLQERRERRHGNSGQDCQTCGLERPGTTELCCPESLAKAAGLYFHREEQIIVNQKKHENTVCVLVCV